MSRILAQIEADPRFHSLLFSRHPVVVWSTAPIPGRGAAT